MRRSFLSEAHPTAGASKEPEWARSGKGVARDENVRGFFTCAKTEVWGPQTLEESSRRRPLPEVQFGPHEDKDVPVSLMDSVLLSR